MATVENRIVEMRFDNAEFERRVGETMKTLAGLDKAIAEVGTKSGVTDLAKQVSGFDTSQMTNAIENVSAKFIAMSAIAITALQNITNRVIDTGIQIGKSLSIEQIVGGFKEYELKIGAIQTIMAGSGESLEVVNQKLQELNTYSDQTIYSFADMTQNIGKFTNAGVDLDTAVASIKGIANVAALSGANAEEASRSMYNFAQALSSGSVKLMDWKSIELANMATEEFKQQLIDTAVEVGTLTKRGDEFVTSSGTVVTATKGFNESLSDAWLTTEALNQTLGDYADASTDIGARATAAASDVKTFSQLMGTVKESIGSGWAQTFELLFGNFDEAKWLFSGINDSIGKFVGAQADHRNKVLQDWRDLGGWGTMLEGFFEGVKNVGLILKPVKNAFRDVFPPMTGERLFAMTEAFRDFAKTLEPSGQTLVNIGHIFKGLFNVLDIGWELFKIGAGVVKDFVKELTGLGGGGALQFMADIGKSLEDLTVEGVVQAFKDGFEKINEFIKSPIPVLQDLWEKIKDFFSGISIGFPDDFPLSLDNLAEKFEFLGTVLETVKGVWATVKGAFGNIADFFTDMFSGGPKTGGGETLFDTYGKKLKEDAEQTDWAGIGDTLANIIGVGLLGGLLAGIIKLFKNGINIDFTGGFLTGMKDALSELTGVLDAMQTKLKAEALKDIAVALAILAGAVLVLSMIDAEDLAKAMTAMAVGFGQLVGVFEVIQKLGFTPADTAKFIALSVAFAALGIGSLVLAAAAKVMSTLDWEEIAKGLIGITGLLAALVGVTKALKGDDVAKVGGEMIILGGGLLVMGLAMKLMGSMDWEEMAKGLIGVASGIGGLIAAMKLMPKDMGVKATQLLGIAGAMVLLSVAMKQMADMDWQSLAKGLIGVGGGLVALGIGLSKMPKNMAVSGFSILIVSTAMVILAEALQKFSEMSWSDILKGTVAIVATLTVISVAMKALEGSLKGGIGLALLTWSLGKLSDVLLTFSNLGFTTILSGLLGIAAVIGTLAAAAYLLEPVVPAMIGLGIALAAIGLGFAGIGLGASLLAGAFVTLGKAAPEAKDRLIDLLVAIGAAIPALMAGVARGLVEMGKVFLENIPFFVEIIGTLIVALLEKLTELIPVLVEFIITLVDALLDLIVELTPKIVVAGWDMLLALLQGFADHIDEVVKVVTTFISGLLGALAEELPGLVESFVNFFSTLFTSVAEGAGKLAPTIMFGVGIAFMQGFWDGMKDVIGKFWTFIKTFFGDIIDWILGFFGIKSPSTVMKEIGINILQGMLDGILEIAELLWTFFVELPATIIGYFWDGATWLFQAGKDLLQGLWNGATEIFTSLGKWFLGLPIAIAGKLGSLLTTLLGAGKDLLTGLWDGAKEIMISIGLWFVLLPATLLGYFTGAVKWLYDVGKAVMQGLWDGMKWIWDKVTGWLSNLNPANWFNDINLKKGHADKNLIPTGKAVMGGLHEGMKDEWDVVALWLSKLNPADELDKDMGTKVGEALAGLSDQFGEFVDLNPTITPVVDLSNIRAASNEINGVLASSNYATAAMIAGTRTPAADANAEATVGQGIQFTQINNSPEALSTAEIYRNTRNQITLAKEELSIP